MKVSRFALISATITAAVIAVQVNQKPIHAARQNETPPPSAVVHAPEDPGAKSYAEHCGICHGDQREGILPGFPPLTGINHRMPENKIADLVHSGKGRMPGFPNLQNGELTSLLHFLTTVEATAQATNAGAKDGESSGIAEAGGALFHQNCAFCHGRDAMGGESGPDLTQSKLVRSDTTGEKIAQVTREGRPDNKMPAFNFSPQEIRSIVAFIHSREAAAAAHPGGRRGVTVADLQTGNADAGKQYFNGAGGCAKCHSPRGDLAGLARRYEGLQLEERMLYPRGAKITVTVTLPSGEKVSGIVAYHDEFTIAMRDSSGVYRSWPANRVHYSIESPVDAHVDLFGKYTDADIHNLMAYLQTLR